MAFERMKGMMDEDLDSLRALLLHQMKDLYDAEQQILDTLPEMEDEANEQDLKTAFSDHRKETEEQVKRLEEAFRLLGEEPEATTCEAMRGLLKEGKEIAGHRGVASVYDAGLAAAASKVEHYEMSGYTSAARMAHRLGETRVAELFEQTLREEIAADDRLTRISQTNLEASAPGGEEAAA